MPADRRSIAIERLDHLVLTVASIDASLAFYTQVLGMEAVTFGNGRKALRFGSSQINLHEAGREFEPKARHVQPGSADLCLIARGALASTLSHLSASAIPIELGPVERSGAAGIFTSVYLRDGDGNLIEIAHLDAKAKMD